MKRYNISVPKKYTKDGEEKTAWNRVGTLVRFDATEARPEGYVLELSMFPETKFFISEVDAERKKVEAEPSPEVDESVRPEDIPF